MDAVPYEFELIDGMPPDGGIAGQILIEHADSGWMIGRWYEADQVWFCTTIEPTDVHPKHPKWIARRLSDEQRKLVVGWAHLPLTKKQLSPEFADVA